MAKTLVGASSGTIKGPTAPRCSQSRARRALYHPLRKGAPCQATGQKRARGGPTRECQLDLPNAVQQFTFGLVPGLHEAVVRLGPPLPPPRLNSVGPVRDPVRRDRVEQVAVEYPAGGRVALAREGERRLEGLQRLGRSLEADRPRLQAAPRPGP